MRAPQAPRGRQSRNLLIVVVAEGATPVDGHIAAVEGETDAFGHARLGISGIALEREIEQRTGFETRTTILGHVERGGTPLAYDRVLGTRFGVEAIDAVQDGQFGVMVGLRGTEIVRVPIDEALAEPKLVDPELLETAEVLAEPGRGESARRRTPAICAPQRGTGAPMHSAWRGPDHRIGTASPELLARPSEPLLHRPDADPPRATRRAAPAGGSPVRALSPPGLTARELAGELLLVHLRTAPRCPPCGRARRARPSSSRSRSTPPKVSSGPVARRGAAPRAACGSDGPFSSFSSQWSPTFSKECLTADHAVRWARAVSS